MACSTGELLGVAAAGVLDFTLWMAFGRPLLQVHGLLAIAVMVASGALEGTIAGYFQWTFLSRRYPGMRLSRWVRATAWGAALAWFLGTLPSVAVTGGVLGSWTLSNRLLPLLAVLAGVVFGGCFGILQWLELRRHSDQSAYWILANAAAWPVALGLVYAGVAAVGNVAPPLAVFGAGVLTGVAAGAALGLITGLFLPLIRPLGESSVSGARPFPRS